jgi:hypothetical protein
VIRAHLCTLEHVMHCATCCNHLGICHPLTSPVATPAAVDGAQHICWMSIMST